VHIVFHGCNQQRAKAGDAFVKDTGFANWADANRLIVLFPQVDHEHAQSAGLLGLVGLHGPRVSDPQGAAGGGRAAHAGSPDGALGVITLERFRLR
jgi:poly(3-hydroxybutyrate) depolymerase